MTEETLAPPPAEGEAAGPFELQTEETNPEISTLKVIEGMDLSEGRLTTSDEEILSNIRHSIRLGHPQVQPAGVKPEVVCLVGGGPSLNDTEEELRELVFEGALVVTVNGSYHWCIERNIRPSAQVLIDARAFNSRFVQPDVPKCRYYIGSQAHPDTWKAVQGREFVGIFHSVGPPKEDDHIRQILDDYYKTRWVGVAGGTTVVSRALGLLRTIGYMRFHLFGVDSCFLGGEHHAYDQPENSEESRVARVGPADRPDLTRSFRVTRWHLKQFEDFLKFLHSSGNKFLLNVHGEGLLAYALRTNAQVVIEERTKEKA
jgi:hypothetical protein